MSAFPAVRPFCRPMTRSIFDAGKKSAEHIIAGLFAQGQQGFWLAMTDFASLSQDSAGTLPYTALEQPVGRVLDRSGRGNHASQPTSTARGAVSARVNLLQKTDGIDSLPWVKLAGGTGSVPIVTDNYGAAPDGSMTAARVQMTTNGGSAVGDISRLGQSAPVLSGTSYTQKVYIKSLIGPTILWLRDDAGFVVQTLVTITNEWQLIDAAGVALGSSSALGLWVRPAVGTSGVADYLVWHPSMTPTAQASIPYQRVNTPTDYDAVGFPKYLRLDGTDDFYTCGGGGSTAGFFYSDVVRPMGGAGTRRVIWSDRSGNNGYELAINTANKLEFSAGNGTAITTVETTQLAAIAEGKRYEVMDDGTNLSVQIDGSAPVTVVRPVVTAGSSTITLYRGVSTGYFKGQITEPIYRAGPPPSAYERGVIRAYQMQKAGL